MKRIWIPVLALMFGITANAGDKPEKLYAQSAVIMDADSGRVLFEKNGREKRAMASTTKIMTCILALENGNPDDIVNVSENAARQPKVHLGMQKGEQFYLKDLLYSLMLESHNDSAVAIAEHIGGTVEEFAGMMNAKAKELGCNDTYFITPNGLDAVDERGKHTTTAENLAGIMSYCITKSPRKDQFLQVTGTPSYSFSDVGDKRSFSCNNHNAFLQMMDGALSGKTGFTGDAGYCYVGALKRDERTFVVALLGCGWPNHKTYKWTDTKKLMTYGLENYQYRDINTKTKFPAQMVENGIPESGILDDDARLEFKVKNKEKLRLLIGNDEEIQIKTDIKKKWQAPVKKGEPAGTISYCLGNEVLREYEIVTGNEVRERTVLWCLEEVFRRYTDGLVKINQ